MWELSLLRLSKWFALVWSGSSYQQQPGNVWHNRKQCQALPGATEQAEEREEREKEEAIEV